MKNAIIDVVQVVLDKTVSQKNNTPSTSEDDNDGRKPKKRKLSTDEEVDIKDIKVSISRLKQCIAETQEVIGIDAKTSQWSSIGDMIRGGLDLIDDAKLEADVMQRPSNLEKINHLLACGFHCSEYYHSVAVKGECD